MAFHQKKADANKESWEQSDFPILCETCLGDNPYVRMTREPNGGACKICERPFTVFRWKPGPQARFKKTEVCQMCAKVKNVCQTCVLDLQYGLPVEVRDSYLQQAAAKAGIAGGASALALATRPAPTSDVNRNYALQQAERAYEDGTMAAHGQGGIAVALPQAHEALMRMARTQPYYQRNLARLCTFFAKGECNRGAECPFRHEMPRDKGDPLAQQNIKDRYHGTEDPVAAKMLGRLGMGPLAEGGEGQGGGRGAGAAPSRPPEPPADPSATTLWIAGVTESIAEDELRSAFTPHGEVLTVRCVPAKQCAFVEMGSRQAAEAAVGALWNSLNIGGAFLRVAWARPKSEEGSGGHGRGGGGGGGGGGAGKASTMVTLAMGAMGERVQRGVARTGTRELDRLLMPRIQGTLLPAMGTLTRATLTHTLIRMGIQGTHRRLGQVRLKGQPQGRQWKALPRQLQQTAAAVAMAPVLLQAARLLLQAVSSRQALLRAVVPGWRHRHRTQ